MMRTIMMQMNDMVLKVMPIVALAALKRTSTQKGRQTGKQKNWREDDYRNNILLKVSKFSDYVQDEKD